MVDATISMRCGEKAPIYGLITAAPGHTVTIGAGAAVTLTDTSGNPAGGIAGAPVTGYDTGALAAARVWYDLDTGQNGANLPAGRYALTFSVPVVGDETPSIPRLYEPAVFIDVAAPWA